MIQVHASFAHLRFLVTVRERLQSLMSAHSRINLGSPIGAPAPRFEFGERVQSSFDSENENHYINRGVIVGIVWNHPDWPSRSGQWAYYAEFYQMPSDPHLSLPWTDLMIEDELEEIDG